MGTRGGGVAGGIPRLIGRPHHDAGGWACGAPLLADSRARQEWTLSFDIKQGTGETKRLKLSSRAPPRTSIAMFCDVRPSLSLALSHALPRSAACAVKASAVAYG